MAQVGTGSSKSRFIRTKWPITEGLTAGTTRLPKESELTPQKSFVLKKDKDGLNGR